MKSNLSKIKSELESYASDSNLSELQVIEKLKVYYFNKKINDNLKLYKKKKKKVSEITRDLQMSPRKFYAILRKKNIQHTTYNKVKSEKE